MQSRLDINTPPSKAVCRSILTPHPSPLSSLLFLFLFLLLAGCPKPESKPEAKTIARPLEGLKLRLAVVDDPFLIHAVMRVCGEWNTQTGAELEIEKLTEEELVNAEMVSADAVLCPSHLLGVLTEHNLLAPVPQRILRDAEWGDLFELPKLREAAYGGRVMAVPFGSPVFCCYYRADLLEKLGHRPPHTWAEYHKLAKLLAEKGRGERGEESEKDKTNSSLPLGGDQSKKNSPLPLGEDQSKKNSPLPLGEGQGVRAAWSGTIEPLAPGWAGLVLLARAAPYAKHRDNYSTFFNIDTMKPLIAGQPFVQALEELVAAAKTGPADPFRYDPMAARSAFWDGQCGMVLSWPTAADEGRKERGEGRGKGLVASATSMPSSQIPVGFCELPGSRRVYNLSTRVWDERSEDDDTRVPLLAIAGRLGVVNAKSTHIDAAFQLLLWLSDSRMSPQISAASPATTFFRQSNLKSPNQWVENLIPPLAAVQYGDATEAALSHEQWLGALRIPGRAEYLAALDEAVAAAVRGENPPLNALLEADKKWREITARLGLEQQRNAYRHSLGFD